MKNIQYMVLACTLLLSGQLFSLGVRKVTGGGPSSSAPTNAAFNNYINTTFNTNLQGMYNRTINQEELNRAVNAVKEVAREHNSDMTQVAQASTNLVKNSRQSQLTQADKNELEKALNQAFNQ